MKKRTGLLLLLLMLVSAVAYADPRGWLYAYYTDDTFTYEVGEQSKDCDGTLSSWGTTSNYRVFYDTNCFTNQTVHYCQEYNGTQWVDVTCP